mmetsp:Transcript_11580/g.17640  ORF Transcript_11580/g.17640 Transcript_11580/m.17640 type:complete len:268 (+) Transcript_11580:145-948(+)
MFLEVVQFFLRDEPAVFGFGGGQHHPQRHEDARCRAHTLEGVPPPHVFGNGGHDGDDQQAPDGDPDVQHGRPPRPLVGPAGPRAGHPPAQKHAGRGKQRPLHRPHETHDAPDPREAVRVARHRHGGAAQRAQGEGAGHDVLRAPRVGERASRDLREEIARGDRRQQRALRGRRDLQVARHVDQHVRQRVAHRLLEQARAAEEVAHHHAGLDPRGRTTHAGRSGRGPGAAPGRARQEGLGVRSHRCPRWDIHGTTTGGCRQRPAAADG